MISLLAESSSLMNMLSLYFLAPAVIAVTGNLAFLGLYLGGGILASACSLLFHRYGERRYNLNYSSHVSRVRLL